MEQQSEQQASSKGRSLLQSLVDARTKAKTDNTILIGTTTLKRMLSAVYDENDPLYHFIGGFAGSSAGFKGKLIPCADCFIPVLSEKWGS